MNFNHQNLYIPQSPQLPLVLNDLPDFNFDPDRFMNELASVMLSNSMFPIVINHLVTGTTKQLPTVFVEKLLSELSNSNRGRQVALLRTTTGLLTSRRDLVRIRSRPLISIAI